MITFIDKLLLVRDQRLVMRRCLTPNLAMWSSLLIDLCIFK
jgi:hypothetical protein